jgi:hypothetical protein
VWDVFAESSAAKVADLQGLPKRLMGFEPTTFCMASRARDSVQCGISLQNRPLLPRERVPPMPGIYREITGVPGLKPDWR